MIGWYHQLKGHKFEQTPGDSEGQGNLECYSPWGRKESDTTLRHNLVAKQQQSPAIKFCGLTRMSQVRISLKYV